jgi:hypothetical protein
MGPHSDLDKRPSLMEVSRDIYRGIIKDGRKTSDARVRGVPLRDIEHGTRGLNSKVIRCDWVPCHALG